MSPLGSRAQRDELAERHDMIRQLLKTDRARMLVKRWDKIQYKKFDKIYDPECEDSLKPTDPPRYESTTKAMEALRKQARILQAQKEEDKVNPKLDNADVIDILVRTVALTVDAKNTDTPALLVYDYDRKLYTYSEAVLAEYVVELMGSVSKSTLQTITMSLIAKRRELAVFEPLPIYKIAVGNGVYNCLTNELEEYDPRYTVTERIDTNYNPDSYDPTSPMGNNRTFSRMCTDLANLEPDRIQLIQQICKAIVTGHSVAPAFFIVVGRGGDGKSTFFQLLVNTIGQRNTAFVNFDEMKQPDKMAETINKKLVLGMDNNVDEYIAKTALLKSLAAHEYVTHSRKYERAISVRFSGTLVQLCNDMPRFKETGESMLRRIVCFHAENSHYKAGTEDRSIAQLIELPAFQEHVLSEILNEDRCGFYRDFNDIDQDLVRATLDNEDVLSQFVNELVSIGALSETNRFIPTSHLYIVYRDWLKQTSPSSSPLSSTSFVQRVSKQMSMCGYEMSTTVPSATPQALVTSGEYSVDMFGAYAESQELKASEGANIMSRVFERTHAPIPHSARRRGATRCSSLEYFGVYPEFVNWVKTEDPEFYSALVDPKGLAKAIAPEIASSKSEADKKPIENPSQQISEARRREEEAAAFRASIQPPVDVRKAHKDGNVEALREYDGWLTMMSKLELTTGEQRISVSTVLDTSSAFLAQIAKTEKDNELSLLADNMAGNTGDQAIRYAKEFLDELLARQDE